MILYNAIRTPDGTIMQSKFVHDYVTHKDANGKYYAVDGGLEYLRRIGSPDYEELSLTDKDDFSKVREVVTWGTRGKDGKQPLKYKKIKDLETEHVCAILDTIFLSEEMQYILRTELEQRDKKNE